MTHLVEALHIIQDECKKHNEDGCKCCPLYNQTAECCGVLDLDPSNWKINDTPMQLLL